MKSPCLFAAAAVFAFSTNMSLVAGQDLVFGDRFNYDTTVTREDGFVDYGVTEWNRIQCDERSREGLDACLAYTDKWHEGQGWEIEDNYCKWCPEDGSKNCGRHHMSPINLERNRGLGFWEKTTEENKGKPGEGAHPLANECIDVHWMKYEDSWCPLDQLVENDAFTIERHALRISQPITVNDKDEAEIGCFVEGLGRRFGRIDYSKGFSQWWFLSHIDIHTPSEHTQEGKRYDAELQLHHFYSVTAEEAGVDNELGTVSIFLQAYDDAAPYRELDKVICEWRRTEYENRKACGLPPIEQDSYPGCFPYYQDQGKPFRRNMREGAPQAKHRKRGDKKNKSAYKTAQDIIMANHQKERVKTNETIPKLKMTEENWGPAEKTEEEWADFIAQESARLKADDAMWKSLHQEFNGDHDKAHEEYHSRHRKLISGREIEWFNYWPMLGVRTEYYYGYSGSQTIPPCYGNFQDNTREETLHWRVMKDPIRIHPRQLKEMKRVLRERISPADSPVLACQPDTAAKVSDDGEVVDVARPLQYWHPVHFKVFCECKDWPSKWPDDRDWCDIEDIYERFYTTPYNFQTEGF